MSKGSILPIYRDHQINKGLLGVAFLEKFIDKGLTFINDDKGWASTKVYETENWKVSWIKKTKLGLSLIKGDESIQKIRKLRSKGFVPSVREGGGRSKLLVDKFLSVNGKEIY